MGTTVPLSPVPTVPAAFPSAVTEADADLLCDLESKLPPEWVIEVETMPEFDWVATVHQGEVSLSETLMFVVFRWPGRALCLTRWMDGSTSAVDSFAELAPVLDHIPSGIFAGAKARLANVKAEGWQGVRH